MKNSTKEKEAVQKQAKAIRKQLSDIMADQAVWDAKFKKQMVAGLVNSLQSIKDNFRDYRERFMELQVFAETLPEGTKDEKYLKKSIYNLCAFHLLIAFYIEQVDIKPVA